MHCTTTEFVLQAVAKPRNSARLYYASGLVIDSEIEFPEFWPLSPDGRVADVRLRIGDVPEHLPDGRVVDDSCQSAGGDVLLSNGDVRILIRDGREIIMATGARPAFARAVLLADPLATLFQQRGLLPLHASVIEVDGKAVAFAAPAGSGKSTLLASLHGRGHGMLCDDLCIVEKAAGRFVVHASFPVLKLRGDAIGAAGKGVEKQADDVPGTGKYFFKVTNGFEPRSLPLAAIYFLEWSRATSPPTIRELPRFEAFKALAASTFYGALLPRMGEEDPLMTASAALTRSVAMFSFARPRDFDRIEESVALLELHLA